MHGLLALSALHYAYLHPQEQKKWDIISVHHQSIALRFFALRLSAINKDNCEAYFWLATLIYLVSMCCVAHNERLGRSVSLNEVSQSFMLLHGVRGILSYQPIEVWREHGGPLGSLLRTPVLSRRDYLSLPFQKRLDAVTVLAREVPAMFSEVINPQSVCVLAVESMRRVHQLCKSNDENPSGPWGWPSSLPPMFIEMIGNRHPTALVILAHYLALTRPYEQGNWLFRGWSATVMGLVDEALDNNWQPWIHWPKRSVMERINIDDMEG
ncbi:uncharacterized protein ColSpa_06756 [Colletotrichum spaethianum]|uniref:C6 zinc finger protein n=1 Tax=Colletotrichum spaethianum TaxID=700344 RepID=A0AA37LHD6_9PEZI|nr:uncharacterized protein ColSpa_06756 [Colletotrichum spaethianum]GKT46575.1 hypothetical protein ColSpa_06756 [Colletotrichum spaethianum]